MKTFIQYLNDSNQHHELLDEGMVTNIINKRIIQPLRDYVGIRRSFNSSSDVTRGLLHENPKIRLQAAQSGYFGPEHMDAAMDDPSEAVRLRGVKSPYFKKEHMEHAMDNFYPSVVHAAVMSDHFSPKHMRAAMESSSVAARTAAVQSQHFGPKHMEAALKDDDANIAIIAIKDKNFRPMHYDLAKNHPLRQVRRAFRSRMRERS